MKIRTHYNGYFNSEVKKYFKKEDGIFQLYGDGQFMYVEIKKEPCYNAKGEYLGEFETEKHIKKYELNKVEESYYKDIIQLNYDFYFISGKWVTIDEINDLEDSLVNSKLIKCSKFCSNFRFDSSVIHNNYNEYKRYVDVIEPFDLIEICYVGNSARIINTVNKKLYELDYKQYRYKKEQFIKNNPEYKNSINTIYMHNIEYLMRFWDVNKKQLFNKRFNVFDKTIKKLHRKINYKQTHKL